MSLRRVCRTAVRISWNWLKNRFDPPVVILLYHRVASLPSDPQLLAVSPENFQAHLKFLKNHFPILRFEDDWSDTQHPSVAITFDDGYADNVTTALPILEQAKVPATFFVSTGIIGTSKEFWWDELERIVLDASRLPATFALHDREINRSWPTTTAAERRKMYHDMHALMRRIDPQTCSGWLQALCAWAQAPMEGRPSHRAMTVDELRRLAMSPYATIGAHGVSHSPLACLSAPAQQREIAESKQQLQAWTGRAVSVFSYPFGGKAHYSGETVALCRQSGFIKAAANYPGQVHKWTDLFQLPRQVVRDWDAKEFAKKMHLFTVA